MPKYDEKFLADRIHLGKTAGQSICVYGLPASELGIPAIVIQGDVDALRTMKPETAQYLADALRVATQIATESSTAASQ